MNNKVVYANEATITSTRTGTEVVAEIDNFKFEQYLDAFKFNNWIGMVASLGFIVETFLV